MFEDIHDKVELDLIHARPSGNVDDEIIKRTMTNKLTVEQVCNLILNCFDLSKRYFINFCNKKERFFFLLFV